MHRIAKSNYKIRKNIKRIRSYFKRRKFNTNRRYKTKMRLKYG